jgi:ribulose-bisphosphate carboxylase large chain
MVAEDEGLVVTYVLKGDPGGCAARARLLAIEQTAEVSPSLCAGAFFEDRVLGRVESIAPVGTDRCEVVIRFPADVVGTDFGQLFSVVFGNVSLWDGVRVAAVRPTPGLAARLGGPRFGIEGVRARLGVPERPLLMSAVKPLGRSPSELAAFAYDLARGGIDLVKDDHGITDQVFAPFEARVEAVSAAVARANGETGRRCLYCPTVTGPVDRIVDRARFARGAGAGAVLLSPMVVGPDFLRVVAREADLPVIAHPALTGAFFAHDDHGIALPALLGTLMRLAGADLVVFPGWGGRFPFTREGCQAVDRALKEDLGGVRSAFPVPAGGLSLDHVPDLRKVFGRDVVFLIGSALYERSPDLAANAAFFLSLVETRPA